MSSSFSLPTNFNDFLATANAAGAAIGTTTNTNAQANSFILDGLISTSNAEAVAQAVDPLLALTLVDVSAFASGGNVNSNNSFEVNLFSQGQAFSGANDFASSLNTGHLFDWF